MFCLAVAFNVLLILFRICALISNVPVCTSELGQNHAQLTFASLCYAMLWYVGNAQ